MLYNLKNNLRIQYNSIYTEKPKITFIGCLDSSTEKCLLYNVAGIVNEIGIVFD